MNVIEEIAAERQRQIDGEGFNAAHDDDHYDQSLSAAAACYALHKRLPSIWPWGPEWWKPSSERRDLIKAGALIVNAGKAP